MNSLLPTELAALATALPKLVGTCETEPAPVLNVVINHDYDQDETEVRIYANGELLHSVRALVPESGATVEFHLLDSGPWDSYHGHDWYTAALERAAYAPTAVRTYVAEQARLYHGPAADCHECVNSTAPALTAV